MNIHKDLRRLMDAVRKEAITDAIEFLTAEDLRPVPLPHVVKDCPICSPLTLEDLVAKLKEKEGIG